MDLCPLTAVSPLDGRYHSKTAPLSQYFSEFSLIKYRIQVEVEYFIALSDVDVAPLSKITLSEETKTKLRDIYKNFTLEGAQEVKKLESVTNHDVKAVEYFLQSEFKKIGLEGEIEWIHFGLTSQDVNNTAIPLMLRDAVKEVYLPAIAKVIKDLDAKSKEWIDVPMLARTHGQPATPTRVGKELMVFVERINNQIKNVESHVYLAKFGGATGGFNAHVVAFPTVDWCSFGDKFIAGLGLKRSQFTTQIAHYDDIGQLFDALKRINVVLMDLSRDVWQYISLEYFKQKIMKNEVGSSTMPHKVNPIDFENCEGNIGIANALFDHLTSKLPVSRLQRDLTDSTALRNVGVPLGHTVIALSSLLRGLGKLVLNKSKLQEDLEANWAITSEAIQTILRREGVDKPYEKLKELTRKNTHIGPAEIKEFVLGLSDPKITDQVKQELLEITPHNYVGVLPQY